MENAVVLTTTDSAEAAKILADKIIAERLGACVQALPIQSIFEWKGAASEEAEVLLLIKTQLGLLARLEKFIKENHSYETPEIIAIPIIGGSKEYQEWIVAQTT